MLGLYVHIPFCARKCHYCDFAITTDRSVSMRERFFKALTLEVRRAADLHGRLVFDTLYLGGGTPSEMTPEETASVFSLLRECFDFIPGAEITFEMNPGDGSPRKLETLRRLGVNRISLGAQSFQDRILRTIGRIHHVGDILQTFEMLRTYGFGNINLDLIARLPEQSCEDFEDSLRRTIALRPEQVTVYDLDVKEGTVFGVLQARGRLVLSDEETHERMALSTETLLKDAGYRQYELCTYARPGFESRHNLVYWTGGHYLGFGPGAVSYMEDARFQLAADNDTYVRKCLAKDWGSSFREVLTPQKHELELLITLLRLEEGIDLEWFEAIRKRLETEVDLLVSGGLLERTGSRVLFSPRGRLVAEGVFAELVGQLSPDLDRGLLGHL